jgi:hypothetical protein
MDDEGATETGATNKGTPDVRMKDKGVTETPILTQGRNHLFRFSLHRHIGKVTVTLNLLMH